MLLQQPAITLVAAIVGAIGGWITGLKAALLQAIALVTLVLLFSLVVGAIYLAHQPPHFSLRYYDFTAYLISTIYALINWLPIATTWLAVALVKRYGRRKSNA